MMVLENCEIFLMPQGGLLVKYIPAQYVAIVHHLTAGTENLLLNTTHPGYGKKAADPEKIQFSKHRKMQRHMDFEGEPVTAAWIMTVMPQTPVVRRADGSYSTAEPVDGQDILHVPPGMDLRDRSLWPEGQRHRYKNIAAFMCINCE